MVIAELFERYEGAKVLISALVRLLELSRCAFPPHMDCGSLLPLSGDQPAGCRMVRNDARHGALALAAADSVLRPT